MGDVDVEQIKVNKMSSKELEDFCKKNAISLSVEELKQIPELLDRNPTLTELHIFNTQWSEHTSYKSSRDLLKTLPTKGSNVILGPSEDAGIVYFTDFEGERYGIAMSHESHNHPSQVVPYEGAATGIGGNVRDVLCMGARVIACADPLRFGDPLGKQASKVKYIANQVIEGIAGYGNPLGVPVIAGDICSNNSFDDNCLVNVVTLGLVKEQEIIHSIAPAADYDLILVGKATDNSGFGGAAFSSLILDENDRESNRGAVQVPDPFLKNVLVRATEAVFKEAREKNVTLGFKDLGAGGIMCCSSELASAAGLGAEINLDFVHTSMKDLPPFVIACSETQERFIWACPPEFSETILRIYNKDFDLPNVSAGAMANVIGKTTNHPTYVLKHKEKIVCNAVTRNITDGIKHERSSVEPNRSFKEPKISSVDYKKSVLDVLAHPNVASKAPVYKHYDAEVQGLTTIRPGEADAGMQTPIAKCNSAIALSVDSNPVYARIDPYHGAVSAVAEAMRNVAAVGATPIALTDCLCFGNPEKPEQFWDFEKGVEGLKDAATNLYAKGSTEPVPFVGGNVSFYNESASGKSVDPSAIVACLGKMDDVSKAITMKIKGEGNLLFMVGDRFDELGGSVFYQTRGFVGSKVPIVDFEKERNMIYAIIDAIDRRLLLSCHDISDGGLIASVAEMILGGSGKGNIGISFATDFSTLDPWKVLFSETSGFVIEVNPAKTDELKELFAEYGVLLSELGQTGSDNLSVYSQGEEVVSLSIDEIRLAWTNGFSEAFR